MKRNRRKRCRSLERLEVRNLLAGDLITQWRAEDLAATISDGQRIESWVDSVGGTVANGVGTPVLAQNAFGGRSAARFDASDDEDFFDIPLATSPLLNANDFSIVVAFSTDSQALQGGNDSYFEATGLVDANSQGFSKDWGVVINSSGQVGVGMGRGFLAGVDSLYSEVQSLNDGQPHIAVITRSQGNLDIYVDGNHTGSLTGANPDARARTDLAIGSLATAGGSFTGDIAEVRVYDGQLSSDEANNVYQEVLSFYNNQAPIANDDSYSTVEDGFFLSVTENLGLLSNDSDPDGDPLTVQVVDQPANGKLTLRPNGSFIYDPNPNFFGTDTFTYSAVDFRPSEPATVTITVAPQYDPVQPVGETYKVLSGTVLNVTAADGLLVNDVNVDQNPLEAVLETDVANGSLNLNKDGSFSYDPNGFTGSTSFSYRIHDGQETTAPVEVNLIINSAPNPVDDQFTIDEDETFEADSASGVFANDSDSEGNPFTATLVQTTQNGQLTFNEDGSFVYVPNLNFFGTDTFSYTLTDGIDDATRNATATINVTAVNDAPVATPDLVLTFINEATTIAVEQGLLANDTDVDSANLTVSVVDAPKHGTLQLQQDGSFTFTPEADFVGADSFSYQASDGSLSSDVTTVSVVVASLDEQIVINEVHYDPPVNTVPAEFIELLNQGNKQVDISNWFFSGGINYVIPEGTVLNPGDYLVVAQDPTTLKAEFDVDGIGPYRGRLSSTGERLVLRNADREIIDTVDYRQGFPWPIAAGGDGPSMELINPTLDNDLGGSWRAGTTPTPGVQNSVFDVNAAPHIRQVNHSPQQPTSEQEATITAKVTDPNGVKSVKLEYQIVLPGSFIPTELPFTPRDLRRNADTPREINPAYNDPANWTTLAMVDDGTNGDEIAGDSIYTTVIPAQGHRTLVRYRITVTDVVDESVKVPYADDAASNFAYFVYDGIPEYNGHSVEVLESLPVYHLIVRPEDMTSVMAYSGRDQIAQFTQARFTYNWQAAMVFDGKVYDNINFRLRGANGRYHLQGKRSMRFRFNDGSYFEAKDQDGNPFSEKLRTLTTSKMFENRQTLTYSLNEAVNFRLFDTIGVPALKAHYSHFRVIDDVQEAPDQWSGDFWGFNFMLETYDVRFLDEHGLERGNLYKLINQTRDWEQQQRYQAPNGALNGDDHDNIERNLTGRSSPEFIDAHVNMEKYISYHTLTEAIRNYDYWPDANKNMVYYFEPEYTRENEGRGKLWILPWDTDASWGPTWNSGHDVVYNSIFSTSSGGGDNQSNPEFWPAYYNQVREIRDLLWQPDQIEPLIEEVADILRPMEQADADRWNGGPREQGRYNGLSGAGMQGIDALVEDMKNFAFTGGNWPGGGVGRGGRAAHLDRLQGARGEDDKIPNTPRIAYSGEDNFPASGLKFTTSAFTDPQGNDSFGAMEWRIAEITDPDAPAFDPNEKHKLEWTASWESGELTEFTSEIVPPSISVTAGRTYRARVRMKDDTGRWSHWSDPVQFTATAATSSDAVDALRVSEVHYNPADPNQDEVAAGHSDADDFEFLEFVNISDQVLDLSGVELVRAEVEGDTQGVTFRFLDSNITQLQPGERVLVVEDLAAFAFRYGKDLPVAGAWSGALSNGGEQLTVMADGFQVQQFTYDDAWHPTTDGDGPSLVIVNQAADLAAWNTKEGWRASAAVGGSPGASDQAIPGDSNGDGVFNSADLVLVFAAGEYEDDIANNSTFEEGDWNGDGDFGSGDLVFAFEAGTYVNEAASLRDIAASIRESQKHNDVVVAVLDAKRAQDPAIEQRRFAFDDFAERDLIFEQLHVEDEIVVAELDEFSATS